jgi:hypothetical protein
MGKTKLRGFDNWYRVLSGLAKLNPDPDMLLHSYDYLKYYNKYARGREEEHIQEFMRGDQHFTDEFKLPTHPTFSDESIYSNETTKGGHWKGETFQPSEWNYLINKNRN